MLGPLLFTIYINSLDYDIQDANFHLYSDDSVMYCSASSIQQAVYKLQSAFDVIQSRIYNLKLALNVDKTKYMLFSGSNVFYNNISSLQTKRYHDRISKLVQISWHYCGRRSIF